MTKQERVCERHTRYANADGDDHAGDGEGHGGSYNSLFIHEQNAQTQIHYVYSDYGDRNNNN